MTALADTSALTLPPLAQRDITQVWSIAVSASPDKEFLVVDGETFTYAEAEVEVAAVAAMLLSRDVGRGDRVALLLDNRPEYVWLLLAIARIGAVGVPIHAEARGELMRHFFDTTDCGAAVVAASFVDEIDRALTGARPRVVWVLDDVDLGVDTLLQVGELQVAYEPLHDSDLGTENHGRFNDEYLYMFTSGTSGPSKAAAVAQAQPITHSILIAQNSRWTVDERIYTCLPLSHANAQCNTLFAVISLGATMIMTKRFSVSRFWSDIQRFEATATSLLGSMLQLLWRKDPSDEEHEHRLTTIHIVPFPGDPTAYEKRYGAKLCTLYGLTEAAPISISRPGEGYDRPRGMSGKVLREHNDVQIVDHDDLPVPVGTVGEITVRRHEPWVTVQRYVGRPDATLHDFRNFWFHTGDFGYLDEDDYLYFTGRKSDSLRRRGENVSISELEEIVELLEGVSEAAVIGVESDLGDMGEDDIAVFVTLVDGHVLTPEDLDAAAQHRIPRYMLPRYIRVLDDFPRTGTNKVRKTELRKLAEEEPDAFFDAEAARRAAGR